MALAFFDGTQDGADEIFNDYRKVFGDDLLWMEIVDDDTAEVFLYGINA